MKKWILPAIFLVSFASILIHHIPKTPSGQTLHLGMRADAAMFDPIAVQDQFPDAYAGAYYDRGRLHLLLTSRVQESEVQPFIRVPVTFHDAKYSLHELSEAYERLTDRMPELRIAAMGINERTNKIEIYFHDASEESKDEILKIVDPDAVQFMEQAVTIAF